MAFGMSVSRSNSFRDALLQEIDKIVDRIYSDHEIYLPSDKLKRTQIVQLVQQLLSYSQMQKNEKMQAWNQITTGKDILPQKTGSNSRSPVQGQRSINKNSSPETNFFKKRGSSHTATD
jgi:hypothetical protein